MPSVEAVKADLHTREALDKAAREAGLGECIAVPVTDANPTQEPCTVCGQRELETHSCSGCKDAGEAEVLRPRSSSKEC